MLLQNHGKENKHLEKEKTGTLIEIPRSMQKQQIFGGTFVDCGKIVFWIIILNIANMSICRANEETYNFYYKKAPQASKPQKATAPAASPPSKTPPEPKKNVPQNTASIAPKAPVEETRQTDDKRSSETLVQREKRGPTGDLFIGLVGISKSDVGLSIGGHVYTKSGFGFRLSLFGMANIDGDDVSFSAFGESKRSNKNSVHGADFMASYDLFHEDKVRIAPLFGLQALNVRTTRKTKTFDAYGFDEKSEKSSSYKLHPAAGISATFYFTERFGANLNLVVPTEVEYSALSAHFVLSI